MAIKWTQNNKYIINKLKEFFTEQVSNKILKSPILWGQHTFSNITINQLTIFYDKKHKNMYILHPYTRDIFSINKTSMLPENTLIHDLLLIFAYCRSIKLLGSTLKGIFIYFIQALLIQQKQLNQTDYIKVVNNRIQDLLLKELVKFFKCNKQVIKILKATNFSKKLHKPSNTHINGIFFMAAKKNNERLINLILSKKFKINVNLKDKNGKTLLHWACYHGNYKLVKSLLVRKADHQMRDNANMQPMQVISNNNNLEITNLLIKHEKRRFNLVKRRNRSVSCLLKYNHLRSSLQSTNLVNYGAPQISGSNPAFQKRQFGNKLNYHFKR